MFFLKFAAIFGALAVALGAFGAHKLKSMIEPAQITIWHTGVEYQFYHVGALLAVGILSLILSKTMQVELNLLNYSGWCFIIGTFLFSGSLYLIALRHLLGLNSFMMILGPLTPTGGLFFMAGWVLLLMQLLKIKA